MRNAMETMTAAMTAMIPLPSKMPSWSGLGREWI